jgi:hypothetical protein
MIEVSAVKHYRVEVSQSFDNYRVELLATVPISGTHAYAQMGFMVYFYLADKR